jgi:L-threonylcarbamoyladenylate synthase
MPLVLPIDPDSIARAAAALRAGALVAFPTETVYGLGGDATNDRAVALIFEAKGRPHFNPLIVHLPDRESAERHAVFSGRAGDIADRFWPGALTLVLPRRENSGLSRLVSAGLDTVALRVPAHVGACALLRAADCPVAAPSANPSGRLSPTRAEHVAQGLGDKVAMILDGGPCAIGLESTVLDLTGDRPAILRQGGVPQEAIADALGEAVAVAGADDRAPRSPGMLSSHYAPGLPVRLNAAEARAGEALLGFGPNAANATLNLSPAGDLIEAAANLFNYLHSLDCPPHTAIAVMPIPETGLGRAINDRLRRAAADVEEY